MMLKFRIDTTLKCNGCGSQEMWRLGSDNDKTEHSVGDTVYAHCSGPNGCDCGTNVPHSVIAIHVQKQ